MKRSELGITALLFTFLLFISAIIALAQDAQKTPPAADPLHQEEMTRPTVEGVREFHEVLAPVWHTFLPDTDYQSIREAVPLFKKSMEKLMKAEVPEYYQHVKPAFDSARQNLNFMVINLDSVSSLNNDTLLSYAVEDLHTAFEMMVRVLAPRMQEVEDFHLSLYPLWHQALPKSDIAAIKAAAPKLQAKMDTLMTAEIPEWLQAREMQIKEKRLALRKAVDDLASACVNGDDTQIKSKLTEVHNRFRSLDEAFN